MGCYIMNKNRNLNLIRIIILNFIDNKLGIQKIYRIIHFLFNEITITNFKKLIRNPSPSFIFVKIKDLFVKKYSVDKVKNGINCNYSHNKENILFFMHRNGIDGTSILSISLLKELKKKYNIFSVSLTQGELTSYVSKLSVKNYSYTEFLSHKYLLPDCKFAILNSIESFPFLPYTSKKSINSILLVHEFISQYNKNILDFIKFKSDHIVFSSEILKSFLRSFQ